MVVVSPAPPSLHVAASLAVTLIFVGLVVIYPEGEGLLIVGAVESQFESAKSVAPSQSLSTPSLHELSVPHAAAELRSHEL